MNKSLNYFSFDNNYQKTILYLFDTNSELILKKAFIAYLYKLNLNLYTTGQLFYFHQQ